MIARNKEELEHIEKINKIKKNEKFNNSFKQINESGNMRLNHFKIENPLKEINDNIDFPECEKCNHFLECSYTNQLYPSSCKNYEESENE